MEQIKCKEGSGAKTKIIDNEVIKLMEACMLNKSQRRKLWHIVALEEGFFNVHRRIIKRKLCARGLCRVKLINKLSLTDI